MALPSKSTRDRLKEAFLINRDYELAIVDAGGIPVLVLDNFYRNPTAVRELALSLDYDLDVSSRRYRNYPGQRALISLDLAEMYADLLYLYQRNNDTVAKFSTFVRRPAIFTKINNELVDSSHQRQRVPHIDDDCILAGVTYLTGDTYAVDGGTYFYRHRGTGLSYLPPVPDLAVAGAMKDRGYSPLSKEAYLEFVKSLMFEEGSPISGTGLSTENDIWSVVGEVTYKFNRCVIFPARAFHSPVFSGGSGIRLTQNMFLAPA